MATDEMSSALMELLHRAKIGPVDFLRESLQNLVQALMELEATQQLHAERYEQTDERTGYRNGYRERQWDTRVGTLQLHVPRVRDGSSYPSLLEPRRRAERALVAVVQEAYIHGVSTRRVDDLVQSLGMQGISKSQVSRLCQELDEDVERFRQRSLEGEHPSVWLDATYVKVRRQGRVVSMAVVIATSVRETSKREVIGLDVGYSEDGAFWLQFLKSLGARGLKGVQLVISDAHSGLQQAIPAVLHGARGPRCGLWGPTERKTTIRSLHLSKIKYCR